MLETDSKKVESEKKRALKEKNKAEVTRARARDDKVNKEMVVGLKQREKYMLRSLELRDVIDHLEADKKTVAAFKAAGASMKVPKLV